MKKLSLKGNLTDAEIEPNRSLAGIRHVTPKRMSFDGAVGFLGICGSWDQILIYGRARTVLENKERFWRRGRDLNPRYPSGYT